MTNSDKMKQLIGETVTEDDLKNVDCYAHNHLGLFIPSVGFCEYSLRPGHTHPAYMIIITFDNDVVKQLSNRSIDISLRPDHYLATILSPDIPHKEIGESFHHYYCIMIEKEYFESQYLLYEKDVPRFEWSMFAICHDALKALNQFAFEHSKHMANADITLDAQEIILTHWMIRSLLGESYDMRAISSEYSVARAQHYMEQHFGEKLTLTDLAALGSVSISVLNRKFKKETELTVMEYLTYIRLEKAKKMLRRPEKSITEIADFCGFGSSAHFAEIFRKANDSTPSEYRKMYKND